MRGTQTPLMGRHQTQICQNNIICPVSTWFKENKRLPRKITLPTYLAKNNNQRTSKTFLEELFSKVKPTISKETLGHLNKVERGLLAL